MKILALVTEPAEYTLDLIENIYRRIGVDYVFMHGRSEAGKGEENIEIAPAGIGPWIRFAATVLRKYEALVINEYTSPRNAILLLMDILYFHKPVAIESDTQLSIPSNGLKRLAKSLWLNFIFRSKYVYGFAGGSFAHKDLFRHYGMDERRIYLMPMMVDNPKYGCFKGREHVSARAFRFGYLGRLVALKQVDKIVESIGELKKSGLDIAFDIVGDGEEREAIAKAAAGLPVAFKGRLFGEEKIKALQSLDCLILYSSYEPWGLVVNEALSAGVPVIVSDKVGARFDLVEELDVEEKSGRKKHFGATGLVVSSEDRAELTSAMERMVLDRACYESFKHNALERMKYWNYDLYSRQFVKWIGNRGRD